MKVDRDNGLHIEYPKDYLVNVREHLHEKLDELITVAFADGGGECQVTFDGTAGEFTLRLTLCDFTNETLCEHCDGTGLKAR